MKKSRISDSQIMGIIKQAEASTPVPELWPSEDGQILLDGHDSRNLSANEARQHFGVVPQETVLFPGTIYDNLTIASSQAALEQVVHACRMPHLKCRPYEAEHRSPGATAALNFAPEVLAVQERPPAPLPRAVLYTLLVLFGVLPAWTLIGKLDIVATAQGKLVPQTYVKVVQPSGRRRREGDSGSHATACVQIRCCYGWTQRFRAPIKSSWRRK
jgi:hypothetical protein